MSSLLHSATLQPPCNTKILHFLFTTHVTEDQTDSLRRKQRRRVVIFLSTFLADFSSLFALLCLELNIVSSYFHYIRVFFIEILELDLIFSVLSMAKLLAVQAPNQPSFYESSCSTRNIIFYYYYYYVIC